mgnify:CR=1 FL=1
MEDTGNAVTVCLLAAALPYTRLGEAMPDTSNTSCGHLVVARCLATDYIVDFKLSVKQVSCRQPLRASSAFRLGAAHRGGGGSNQNTLTLFINMRLEPECEHGSPEHNNTCKDGNWDAQGKQARRRCKSDMYGNTDTAVGSLVSTSIDKLCAWHGLSGS